MMKTEIEKMIEKDYQNCHVPVLCKSKSYATIEKVKGKKVSVTVWEIDDDCELNLDQYEGYPRLYRFIRTSNYMDIDTGCGHDGKLGCYIVDIDEEVYV